MVALLNRSPQEYLKGLKGDPQGGGGKKKTAAQNTTSGEERSEAEGTGAGRTLVKDL
eukprot:CAMPEP_0180119204 /NCGR_PEP_ID=MMETSP0986-20121125/1864_1 /TAXON_ID=697907 /ORGANISM="non described non described, Strain CCMP2293" /LENGTH=56 /DNA_ID=CAMNT_0022058203 /DNA_START=492 /DNA_END=662 /DNA_ORIENTATION=-